MFPTPIRQVHMSMSDQAPQPQAMSWQDQLLDVLRARERTWFVAAVVLILLGALLALLAPGTLPPTPLVGLAVGAAGILLATAVVIGLDVSDVIVRGSRHVEIAGGRVAGTISRSTADIDALVGLIDAHDREGKVRVALTPASRSAGVPGSRANIVAAELAGRGAKVLVTDLTRGGTPAVGLSDVISGERTLGEAVRFDDELYLAHLAVGSEPEMALEGFASWARGLPPDLDVLVAALPPLSEPGVLQAVAGVELVLLLVEVDRTERVDLVASLDAIDAAEVPAELVLVDDTGAPMPATGSGSVEVLSTPGSTPRQRDPDGFDLQSRAGESPTPAPDTDVAGPDDDTGPDDDVAGSDVHDSHLDESDVAGSDLAGSDADPVATDETGIDPEGVDEPGHPGDDPAGVDDTDLRTTLPGAVTPSTAPLDPDDFEDDDGPATAPGGGHVRTIRRRTPGGDDTMAMPPVGRDEPPMASTSHDDGGHDDDPSGDSVPTEHLTLGHDREPSMVDPYAAGPADADVPVLPDDDLDDDGDDVSWSDAPDTHEEPTRHDARPQNASVATPDETPDEPVATVDERADEPHDAGERAHASHDEAPHHAAAPDDEDPVDVVAREQARLSASLQQLAQDVWQRGDGA